jgi:hypothetical protein
LNKFRKLFSPIKNIFAMATSYYTKWSKEDNLSSIYEQRKLQIRQINIAELLLDKFDYKINKKSTTSKNPVLEGKSGTFIVYKDKNDSSQYRVMNNNNTFNSDIFKFLFDYEKSSFGNPLSMDKNFMQSVWEKLSEYNPSLKTSNLLNSEYRRLGVADLSYSLLAHNSYLQSRGIVENILNNNKYVDVFANKMMYTKDANFLNTAILYKDRNNELVTIESINHSATQSYRAFAANAVIGEGLVKSNVLSTAKDMVIAESFIDAVSYSIIKPEKMTEAFDVGFGGNLKNAQIGHIQYLVETLKPEKIYLINDKDAAGWSYDLKLIAALSPVISNSDQPGISIHLNKDKNEKGQGNNYDIVQIKTVSGLKDFDKNEVNAYLNSIKEKIEKAKIEANIIDFKVDTKFEAGELSFKFLHQEHYLHRLANVFQELLDPEHRMMIDKVEGKAKNGTLFKDYNEKLCNNLGLSKEQRVANYNPYRGMSKEEIEPLLAEQTNHVLYERGLDEAFRGQEIDAAG